ncbi:MAG: hypothetical protein K1000chlam2_00475, partial [Chlamydiae bacterium]|nr:hypothetical protein [Chlamydiota bacterium]
RRLELAEISYMVTRCGEAEVYAVTRMTRDRDVIIEIQKPDIDTLCQLFQNDLYVDKDSIFDAIERQGMFNIISNASVFKVDFIVRKEETYRAWEFKRRKRIKLENIPVWIVAPEDLIISKLFWSKDSISEMQLNDVRNLFSSLDNLDQEYIEKWIKELKLEAIYEKVKAHA